MGPTVPTQAYDLALTVFAHIWPAYALLDGTLKEAWPFLKSYCQEGKVLIVSALQAQDLLEIGSGIEKATIMQKPFVPSALQEAVASVIN